MIKIEVVEKEGFSELLLTSNDIERDRNSMDLIGDLILRQAEKRGGYSSANQIVVSVVTDPAILEQRLREKSK